LPTFSTKRIPSTGGGSAPSARDTIAASRWHPFPVFTCTAPTPVAYLELARLSAETQGGEEAAKLYRQGLELAARA